VKVGRITLSPGPRPSAATESSAAAVSLQTAPACWRERRCAKLDSSCLMNGPSDETHPGIDALEPDRLFVKLEERFVSCSPRSFLAEGVEVSVNALRRQHIAADIHNAVDLLVREREAAGQIKSAPRQALRYGIRLVGE
jgi:hypothetical protein